MAEIEIGMGKSGRRAYGLDDVALVPSRRTRDPEDIDLSWEIDAFTFDLPVMASAMDSVVSPASAIAIGELGGGGHRPAPGALRRAHQARTDPRPDQGDPRRRRHVVRVDHPAAPAGVRRC